MYNHSNEPQTHSLTMRALDTSLWQCEEKRIRCVACSRNCLLTENSVGFCTAIVRLGDTLYSTAYGVVGEVSVTPIENRPVYHYRPGTRTLGIGGLGCNLRCAFCQNWELAFRDARHGGNIEEPNLLPERAVALALEQECQGIAWTFNEPSIAPMYTLDCARVAHEAGLYTVMVTNGFMTQQALNLLGPYIDVYRVDVKSLDQAFYRKVAGTASIENILPVARRAKEEFGIHVEVVTNIMPSLNDSDEHLKRVAEQVCAQLGVNTPWHLTTYVPYAHMTTVPPTPATTLIHARSLALQSGLRFVYTDDVTAPETSHTFCPGCGICVIERRARHVTLHALGKVGECTRCNTRLEIAIGSSFTQTHEGGYSDTVLTSL